LITSVIICVVAFPSELVVSGEKPVIASRISEIISITVLTDSAYKTPNNTIFKIVSEVEILNRDNKTQTVIEQADCYPKVYLNATLVDQSLEIDWISAGCMDMFTVYFYQPNITIEYDIMKLEVNQTGLSYLPDGNYTLWRYIEYGSPATGIGTPGEILLTFISMNSGIMNITYSYFDNPHINGTSLTTMFPLFIPIAFLAIFSQFAAIYKKRKHK
jgi:hypothetical protein